MKRKELMEHEKAHVDEAIKRGYNPSFSLFRDEYGFPGASITIDVEEEGWRDVIAICLAPSNPSTADYQSVVEAKCRLTINSIKRKIGELFKK
jgi:hypothetical protein